MLYQPLARQVMCWMLLHGKTGVGDGWLWGLDSIFRPSFVVNFLVMQEAYVKGVSNWNFNVSDLKKQADMEHLDPVPEATAGATCLACVLRLDLGETSAVSHVHNYFANHVPERAPNHHKCTQRICMSWLQLRLTMSWQSSLEYCSCLYWQRSDRRSTAHAPLRVRALLIPGKHV